MGLAQSVAQAPQQSGMLDQVLILLQEGATPEELLQMGVPRELIEQAMEMITQEAQAPVENMAPTQGGNGLAAQMTQIA